MSKTASDMDNLMSHSSQRNKLYGSVIIIFVCCLLFAQSIYSREGQTDGHWYITTGLLIQRVAIGRHVRGLLRADWLDYIQLGHDWQTKFKYV
jgi:hypothetical protein